MLSSLFAAFRRKPVHAASAAVINEPGPQRLAFTSVTNPRFANAERTAIDCDVVFPVHGPAPLAFTAIPSDPGWEHSEDIYARCLAGEFGPVAPFES